MPGPFGASRHARTASDADATPGRASNGRSRRSMTASQPGPDDLFYSLANADSATEQRRRTRPSTSARHSATNVSAQPRPQQLPDRRQSTTSVTPTQLQRDSLLINTKPSPATDRPSTRAGPPPLQQQQQQQQHQQQQHQQQHRQKTTTPSSHSRFASADWATRFARPASSSQSATRAALLQTPEQPADRRSSLYANGISTPGSAASTYKTAQASLNGSAHDARALARQQAADETESVVSTTAPSTVWDELGELKTRIRKLELTGPRNRPGTSGTAATHSYLDAASDRPRTATTQTTDLTSPNASYSLQPSLSQIQHSQSEELHPLLREALGKARSRLDPNTYRFLESSVFDSLELASMARNLDLASDTMSVATGATASGMMERRIRRKADNLCRSLTELCIAMCEGRSVTPNAQALRYASPEMLASRPGSRDQPFDRPVYVNGSSPVFDSAVDLRRAHTERLDASARPSSRLASRLESRRSSTAGYLVPDGGLHDARPPSGFRINDATSDDDRDATLRGPSRAVADAHIRERSARQLSNGYAGVSPTIRERLAANRSNHSLASINSVRSLVPDSTLLASPTSDAPVDRYAYDAGLLPAAVARRPSSSRRAPPSAAANLAERLEAKRQQRVATAGQLGTATPTSSVSGSLAGLKRSDSIGRA